MTRRRWILLILAMLLVLLAGTLHWASRPQRLTGVLLDRIGGALGLEITATGIAEYHLGGGPRIVVRDLVARQPGATTPVLRARRIALSLPWSTVRARGADLTITRVELDDPVLDLPALQRWQATRPRTDARVPTLTDGLQVRGGQLVGGGWRVREIAIELPELHPDRTARVQIEGRVIAGEVQVPFDLAVLLARPAPDAPAEARGSVSVQSRDWRLAMQLEATGRLRLDADVPGIHALKLGAQAQHLTGTSHTPFVIGAAGDLHFAGGGVSLRPAGIALRSAGAVPRLDAGGRIDWSGGLDLRLEGALARWPQAWPALPAPIGRPRPPVPFVLTYDGPIDLSGATSLQVRHGMTSVDARLRLPEVLEWLEHRGKGSPLPPIAGRLRTPELQIAGAVLEGVEIELEPSAAEAPHATDPDPANEH